MHEHAVRHVEGAADQGHGADADPEADVVRSLGVLVGGDLAHAARVAPCDDPRQRVRLPVDPGRSIDLSCYPGATPVVTGETALRTEKRPGRAETQAGRGFQSDVYWRSEEHTSDLQSLMRISYAVFCLKKKNL